MRNLLKKVFKVILGNLIIIAIPISIFYFFDGAIKVDDLITLKWFPLLSCFIGFYLAGKINRRNELVYLLFLLPSLLIFIPFRYFFFPFILLIFLFSVFGLIVSRSESNKRLKISTLLISVVLFGFVLFSQPLILKKNGFGTDQFNNLCNADVVWDFSNNKPPHFPREKFENFDGDDINLEEFAGKNIYITFWATWCAPCISEKPFLEKLKEEYSDSIIFIDISVDRNKEQWRNYLANHKPTGIQLITKNEYRTRSNFLFDGIPYNILVNTEGLYKTCYRPSILNKSILSSSSEINKFILAPRKIIN